jgi:hypothetical protein
MLKVDDKGVPIRNKDGHVEPVIEYPYATVCNSPSTLKVRMFEVFFLLNEEASAGGLSPLHLGN